jgi:hypothetical protein
VKRPDNRVLAAIVAGAVGVVVVLGGLALRGGGAPPAVPSPSAAPASKPEFLSLSVRSLPVPLVAVVGISPSGRSVAIPIPPSLLVTVPGAGDASVAQASLGSGASLAATISNVLGVWIEGHATTDMVGLTAIVDRAGGITVPGSSTALSGAKVRAYLEGQQGSVRFERWGDVLRGLLAKPLQLQESDLREPGELPLAQPVLSKVSHTSVEELPTQPAQSRFVIADQQAVEKLMSSDFGVQTTPVARVSVLNGSGAPGVGEAVAKLMIPAGFRIVSSQNAQTFGHKTTQVVAQGDQAKAEADRLQQLLGVGRVIVVAQRSGFADITLVVGEDFKGT